MKSSSGKIGQSTSKVKGATSLSSLLVHVILLLRQSLELFQLLLRSLGSLEQKTEKGIFLGENHCRDLNE